MRRPELSLTKPFYFLLNMDVLLSSLMTITRSFHLLLSTKTVYYIFQKKLPTDT